MVSLRLLYALTLAAERKGVKYCNLTEVCDYQVNYITMEVGSREAPHIQGFLALRKHLGCTMKSLRDFLVYSSKTAIQGSFKV